MKIFIFLLAISLTGCVTYYPVVPEGYEGDIATISDSYVKTSRRKSTFYYVKAVNGAAAYNAFAHTRSNAVGNPAGNTSYLDALSFSRDIPSQPVTITLSIAPFFDMPMEIKPEYKYKYYLEGDVQFTPEPNVHYMVRGLSKDKYAAIWIEDVYGNVRSELVERVDFSDDEAVALRDRLLADLMEIKKPSRAELFYSLIAGESEALVRAKLGSPSSIEKNNANIFQSRPNLLIFDYLNLGRVFFRSYPSGSVLVDKVVPKPMLSSSSSVKGQLNTRNGQTLQLIAKDYFRQNIEDTETLDLIAEKIWQERNAKNQLTVDAMAWLCRVLAKSGNSRYRALLESISSDAAEKKLRKHALKSAKILPSSDVDQFIPMSNS